MEIIVLNEENFEEKVLNNKKMTIVDFYADWCGPCKMMSPILEEIANEATNFEVYKVNVEESDNLVKKYGIMSIPCIISFRDGKEYKRSVGLVDKDALLGLVEE